MREAGATEWRLTFGPRRETLKAPSRGTPMAGTKAGTGQPIFFRCSRCRRDRGPSFGWRDHVRLTGKVRHVGTFAPRMMDAAVQYECRDCGHVGWSRHFDLEGRAQALGLAAQSLTTWIARGRSST